MAKIGDRVKVKATFDFVEYAGREGIIVEMPCNAYGHEVKIEFDGTGFKDCFNKRDLLIRKRV